MSKGSQTTRPKHRSDCLNGPRPCPWIGCTEHLCWELRHIKAAIRAEPNPAKVADLVLSMPETCLLDVTKHPLSCREAAEILNCSQQLVQQTEKRALAKLRKKSRQRPIKDWKMEEDSIITLPMKSGANDAQRHEAHPAASAGEEQVPASPRANPASPAKSRATRKERAMEKKELCTTCNERPRAVGKDGRTIRVCTECMAKRLEDNRDKINAGKRKAKKERAEAKARAQMVAIGAAPLRAQLEAARKNLSAALAKPAENHDLFLAATRLSAILDMADEMGLLLGGDGAA